ECFAKICRGSTRATEPTQGCPPGISGGRRGPARCRVPASSADRAARRHLGGPRLAAPGGAGIASSGRGRSEMGLSRKAVPCRGRVLLPLPLIFPPLPGREEGEFATCVHCWVWAREGMRRRNGGQPEESSP